MFFEVSAELLHCGHRVRFRAHGQSMQPTIREGEAITVAPTVAAHVKRGDILLYRCVRGVIAHRVVRIEHRPDRAMVFILRGDASDTCDDPVTLGQVLGKVVGVERAGRCIALDSWKASIWRQVRRYVSHLKEWLVRLPRIASSR
jgi:signal peptidase I